MLIVSEKISLNAVYFSFKVIKFIYIDWFILERDLSISNSAFVIQCNDQTNAKQKLNHGQWKRLLQVESVSIKGKEVAILFNTGIEDPVLDATPIDAATDLEVALVAVVVAVRVANEPVVQARGGVLAVAGDGYCVMRNDWTRWVVVNSAPAEQ